MKKRILCLILTLTFCLLLVPSVPLLADGVTVGVPFSYAGVGDVWSAQWAHTGKTDFQPMVEAATWYAPSTDESLYPFCRIQKNNNELHPNEEADAVRTFTAPADGTVQILIGIRRNSAFVQDEAGLNKSPSSFRLLLNNTTLYPTEGEYRIVTSGTEEQIELTAQVRAGEQLHFIIGAMGNKNGDRVTMNTSVTYTSLETPGTNRVGEVFAYDPAFWGEENTYADGTWSWEWTPAGQTQFSPMTFDYVSNYNRSMYVAGWSEHPYSYADLQGAKMHPAADADTVKTFTAPHTGTVKISALVKRYNDYTTVHNNNSNATPTSLRILVNDTQVYPLYNSVAELTKTTEKPISFSVPVLAGDRIRFVVGGMGNISNDAIWMQNEITYTALGTPAQETVFTDNVAADEWGSQVPNWLWEWRDPANNAFGQMEYRYVADYNRGMYISDWVNHKYNYADQLGHKMHPALNRDTVKTFLAPYDGAATLAITASRCAEYVNNGTNTPTSLRVYLNDQQIWPADGSFITLTSTTANTYSIPVTLKTGDKLRCVVGGMGQISGDAVMVYNTVSYTSAAVQGTSYTYEATAQTWGTDLPHWSWEYRTENNTFSPMTFNTATNQYEAGSAYPYSYAALLGQKIHPALHADTVRTFTAPFTGQVELRLTARRCYDFASLYENNTNATPTSLKVYLNDRQIWPGEDTGIVLKTTEDHTFSLCTQVKTGDKLRCVIGGMGHIGSDPVMLSETVIYIGAGEGTPTVGTAYTYAATTAQWQHNNIPHWLWEYRDANNVFRPMIYRTTNRYEADWDTYPYCYAALSGNKVHPGQEVDTVKTFVAPIAGRVEMRIAVRRYNDYNTLHNTNSSATPTSLRVYLNGQQIWPADGSAISLKTTAETVYTVNADVKAGDKLRCVVGGMGNINGDAIEMYNTVTYRSVGARELAVTTAVTRNNNPETNGSDPRLMVFDVNADNWTDPEIVWQWRPSSGMTGYACPDEAKLRYVPAWNKYVVLTTSSSGFLGVIDYASGQTIWWTNASATNPHSIEILPDGNLVAALSTSTNGNGVRLYKKTQSGGSVSYTQVAQYSLLGGHGVLWDPDRNCLWALGEEKLIRYNYTGGSSPSLSAAETFNLPATPNANGDPIRGGHDLSAVYGDPNRLWVTENRHTYQFDIRTGTFSYSSYTGATVIDHTANKGIGNYPASRTVIQIYPNGIQNSYRSDRLFVTLPQSGGAPLFGRMLVHSTCAFYKIRSWVGDYH